MQIIGIDCATDPAKIGVARGELRQGRVEVLAAQLVGKGGDPADVVSQWVADHDGPSLLTVDAPLGWPAGLGAALVTHRAGAHLAGEANQLFRRETDRVVHERLGKLPLDVGADRIARTALAALQMLQRLREKLRMPIPLAWQTADIAPLAAIEVYPAGTLTSRGVTSSGYKLAADRVVREAMLDALADELEVGTHRAVLLQHADVLDASLCLLAGADFLSGAVLEPAELESARQEGWIWVRTPV
jgi:hypothetical protein